MNRRNLLLLPMLMLGFAASASDATISAAKLAGEWTVVGTPSASGGPLRVRLSAKNEDALVFQPKEDLLRHLDASVLLARTGADSFKGQASTGTTVTVRADKGAALSLKITGKSILFDGQLTK